MSREYPTRSELVANPLWDISETLRDISNSLNEIVDRMRMRDEVPDLRGEI